MNMSEATKTLRQIADRAQAAVVADTHQVQLLRTELTLAQTRLATSREHLAKTHRALYQSTRIDAITPCGSAQAYQASHTLVGGCLGAAAAPAATQ